MTSPSDSTFDRVASASRGGRTNWLTAAERAYEYTKRAIIRGELVAGTMISEGLICDELGLSRTPVHEAFLRLDVEEFLSLASRKGAIVRPMTPHEALDVLEMREAIESVAAERAISGGHATELSVTLGALLAVQQGAIDKADLDRFVEADDDFHTAVVEASRNPIAMNFTRQLRDRQQRLRHQLFRIAPEQLATGFSQHQRLAAAIADGSAEAYRRVLAEHVSVHRGVL